MNRNLDMKPAMNPARPIAPISGRRIHAARWLALALSVGVLALATACSGDADHRSSDADRGSGGVTSAPNVPAPSATTAGGTPAGEDATGRPAGPPVLADGRHPTYLTGLDVARRTVTFDLIQFLTGADAERIWAQTHPDEPEGPPNDYLIVNNNLRLRVLPVADQAHVTVVDTGGAGGIVNVQISLDDLPRHLAGQKPETVDNRLSYAPYWLTVSNGLVVRIEEQFIP
jgi:hypothetical protein